MYLLFLHGEWWEGTFSFCLSYLWDSFFWREKALNMKQALHTKIFIMIAFMIVFILEKNWKPPHNRALCGYLLCFYVIRLVLHLIRLGKKNCHFLFSPNLSWLKEYISRTHNIPYHQHFGFGQDMESTRLQSFENSPLRIFLLVSGSWDL